ncbi:MAG: PrsW family intramembrane metalloprotease [Alistipes sp.]|nr:PrsW family intramembrane metalloprotease [Alistipes sp.]
MYYQILITALLPVAILLFYIYRKDKNSPEPTSQLVKAFLMGILSIPLSLCLSVPFEAMGLYSSIVTTVGESVKMAFFGAAIPEEAAKLFILWLVLRKNPYFDEKMDGIVYAVCVSLGFAAVENVMYLFMNAEEFLSVGIARAIFAVPGHFCFGILMGYYYSLAKFYPHSPKQNKTLVLVAPVIVHGVYDAILFATDVAVGWSAILTMVFLYFCYKMWKRASRSIEEHLQRDKEIVENI